METYIGTKIIKAEPMTRGAYNKYRAGQSRKTKIQTMTDFSLSIPIHMSAGLLRTLSMKRTGLCPD
jgi:hypothetical protein